MPQSNGLQKVAELACGQGHGIKRISHRAIRSLVGTLLHHLASIADL